VNVPRSQPLPKLDPRPWPERHGRVERRPRYDEIAGEREYPLPGCLAVFHARARNPAVQRLLSDCLSRLLLRGAQ
jgi:hypothetical protein